MFGCPYKNIRGITCPGKPQYQEQCINCDCYTKDTEYDKRN